MRATAVARERDEPVALVVPDGDQVRAPAPKDGHGDRDDDRRPRGRGQRVERVTEEVEHRRAGRPRGARVVELVKELRGPGQKRGATGQPVQQCRFQAMPRPVDRGGRRTSDHRRGQKVQAVVLQVEHGGHEQGGGYPVAPPGSPVSEDEAGDGEDRKQHEPRVHARLCAVVVEVGARRHQGRCSSRCSAPEKLVSRPPSGGYREQPGDHRKSVCSRLRPAEQSHPEMQHHVVQRRRPIVGQVVGE